MKKEAKNKNQVGLQRISIENLPKPRKWWQDYAFAIAALALFVSMYSAYLSRKEFVLAHRPYVHVTNRRTEENGKPTMDVNTVLLHCLNAPAKIVDQDVSYLVIEIKEDSQEDIIRTVPVRLTLASDILYPSDQPTSQITILYDFKKEILAKYANAKLRRKIRIDYEELSGHRRYFFEGNWDYNAEHNVWQNGNTFGD